HGDNTHCGNVRCFAEPVGACCFGPNPTSVAPCLQMTAAQCEEQGGEYQGDGTVCSVALCAPASGACCLPDGNCIFTTEARCLAAGGEYWGDFSSCPFVCHVQPMTGACCLREGSTVRCME